MKKIFVAGDIHDDCEALEAFTRYVQSENADKVLINGDFSLRPYALNDLQALLLQQNTDSSFPREARDKFIEGKRKRNLVLIGQMKGILDSCGVPYSVIPGNYDPSIVSVFGEKDLHNRGVEFGETTLFGYGGADAFPRHIRLLEQMGEIIPFDPTELYEKLIQHKPGIVLLHNPPYEKCDIMFDGRKVGSREAARYIMEHTPPLVIAGHIHESGPLASNPESVQGIAAYKDPQTQRKTIVVNPGNLGRFELLDFPSLNTARTFPFGTFSRIDMEDDGTPLRVVHYSLSDADKVGTVRQIAEFN